MTTVVGPKCSSSNSWFEEAVAQSVMNTVGVTPKPEPLAIPDATSSLPADESFAIAAECDFFIASQLERKGHSPPYAKL